MAGADYRTMSQLARGIRNNNPGNIKTGDAWQGKVGEDGPFIIFANVDWGLRALATDLAHKLQRGLVTIRQIITTYAPPSENLTGPYIQSVSDDSGFGPDEALLLSTDTLRRLMRAIVNHEVGEQQSYDYVTDPDIDTGIQLMNQGLLTLVRAAGVALESTVQDAQGRVQWGKVALISGTVVVAYYMLKKK